MFAIVRSLLTYIYLCDRHVGAQWRIDEYIAANKSQVVAVYFPEDDHSLLNFRSSPEFVTATSGRMAEAVTTAVTGDTATLEATASTNIADERKEGGDVI